MILSVIASAAIAGVRLVTDEPEAVLGILDKRAAGAEVAVSEWNHLFATEGYKRLKERELGIKRPFTDDDFRKFVLSPELLAKREHLAKTFADWKRIDLKEAEGMALAYLPKSAKISASIYPLIKPVTNSFVWDTEKNPAIMLYLDPTKSREEFVATLAHEMHHIGYSSSCPSKAFNDWLKKQSKDRQTAWMWIGGFGEGFAVLCQGGGAQPNPYSSFTADARDAWTKNYVHVGDDFKLVQSFFADLLSGKLDSKATSERAFGFFGMLGPWYTVGYLEASSIEAVFGRQRLIDCYSDPRLLLPTYNEAAARLTAKDGVDRPLWSKEDIARLSGNL